ncbi:hypothetical protein ACHAXT_009660 [Thalassiosira profunda]
MVSSWTFRPTALASADNVYTTRASRGRLEHYYNEDNRRASDEGVEILSRPESAKIRTAQWNINSGWRDPHSKSAGLIHTIREADADVVVLNEYRNEVSFEKELRDLGYSFVDCATVDFPTVLATRLEVKEHREIRLSDDRSAMLARVRVRDGGTAWVIGTHINFVWGEQRLKEMEVLRKELHKMGILGDAVDGTTSKPAERVILVGDLNQQREQDYSEGDGMEWARIRSGMIYRKSSEDDGVAQLLADEGFVCAWDATPPPKTNWETARPPATHWSGTIVDYSYGRNVSPLTASISPASWSDHRMTVCDWTWDNH